MLYAKIFTALFVLLFSALAVHAAPAPAPAPAPTAAPAAKRDLLDSFLNAGANLAKEDIPAIASLFNIDEQKASSLFNAATGAVGSFLASPTASSVEAEVGKALPSLLSAAKDKFLGPAAPTGGASPEGLITVTPNGAPARRAGYASVLAVVGGVVLGAYAL